MILAFVPDLIDRSRLTSAAPGRVKFLPTLAALTTALVGPAADAAGDTSVELVIVDLGRPGVLEALEGLPAPSGVRPPVVGYGSHVNDEVLVRARIAGVHALPRSRFFTRLGSIIAPDAR